MILWFHDTQDPVTMGSQCSPARCQAASWAIEPLTMNWNPVDCHHEGLQKAHFSFCSPSHFIFTPYRLAVVMCSPSKWYSTLGRRLSHKTVEEKQEPLKIHIFFLTFLPTFSSLMFCWQILPLMTWVAALPFIADWLCFRHQLNPGCDCPVPTPAVWESVKSICDFNDQLETQSLILYVS